MTTSPFLCLEKGECPRPWQSIPFFPEDEGGEVLEVDVSPTRGSSIALPRGTSGSPLASPQTPSFLQKSGGLMVMTTPFPEEEGELLRGRLCMVMATPSPFSERVRLFLEDMRK